MKTTVVIDESECLRAIHEIRQAFPDSMGIRIKTEVSYENGFHSHTIVSFDLPHTLCCCACGDDIADTLEKAIAKGRENVEIERLRQEARKNLAVAAGGAI